MVTSVTNTSDNAMVRLFLKKGKSSEMFHL